MSYIYIIFGLSFLLLLSLVEPSTNIFFKHLILSDYKKIHFKSEYYRDILKYSPSEILYISEKGFSNNKLNSYGIINKYKKMFYINLLKMYLLGYVDINFNNGKNFEIIKNDVLILDKEYKMLYNYIFNEITKESKIMLGDINNYIEKNYQNNYFFEKWDNLIRKKLISNGFYSTNFISRYSDAVKKYYFFGCIFLLVLVFAIMLISDYKTGIIYLAFYSLFIVIGYYKSKNIKIHSNWSIYEYKKIKALKKFLEDFTIVEERTSEYIKILEDYIVYAAIFDMESSSVDESIEEIRLFLSLINK